MSLFLATLFKLIILFGWLMLFSLYATWAERKESAVIQDRHGANRAKVLGISSFGIFQPFADAIKMLFKEDYIPPFVNKPLFLLAPSLSFFFSAVVVVAIPFGPDLTLRGRSFPLGIVSGDFTLPLVFALLSMGVFGFLLGGLSSRNKYAAIGGMRGAAQILSYEVAMILALLGLVALYSSMDLRVIVARQQGLLWGFLPRWGIFLQPLGFLLFLIAAVAMTKRVPFDMPEGESEIVGFFLEYSGLRFGLFMLTDFVETIVVSLLTTVLFLGGWHLPGLISASGFSGVLFPWGGRVILSPLTVQILQVLVFQAKTVLVFIFLLLVRWTFPRYRFDQVMDLGWKSLLPLGLINLTATLILLRVVR